MLFRSVVIGGRDVTLGITFVNLCYQLLQLAIQKHMLEDPNNTIYTDNEISPENQVRVIKFIASGKVQRFLVGKEIRQSVFGLGGVRHDGDTLVGQRIVEVAHYDDMRAASYAIKRVAQSTHTQRGIDSVGLCLLLTG